MPLVSAKDATDNASNLLGRIAGFNLCLNAITVMSVEAIQQPPVETWEEQPAD